MFSWGVEPVAAADTSASSQPVARTPLGAQDLVFLGPNRPVWMRWQITVGVQRVQVPFRQLWRDHHRRMFAERQFNLLNEKAVQEAQGFDFNLLLDAERRLAESKSAYNRALVSYAVAIKNVHLETGDIFQHCNIQLSDSVASN